jgi:hypothetical protein
MKMSDAVEVVQWLVPAMPTKDWLKAGRYWQWYLVRITWCRACSLFAGKAKEKPKLKVQKEAVLKAAAKK